MAAKRGRPRGLNLNRAAVEDMLRQRVISKQELCDEAGITQGHLADALVRGKGMAPASVRAMADYLGVSAATLAPGLTPGWLYIRPQDEAPEAVAS